MALKGNLHDFPVTQLLNLIHLAGKTGMLVVEHADESVQVSFREGKLAYAHSGQGNDSLLSVLQEAHKLSTAQARSIQSRTGKQTDKEFGLMLVNASYITQQEILNTLQSHYSGVVNRLFTWPDGGFYFLNDVTPPEDKIPVRMGLENLILESSRRLKEEEQLREEIPNLDLVPKFVERPGTNIRNLNLNAKEWRVVSHINAKNTIRQIARAAQVSDLDIRRVIYGLQQAGLLELPAPTSTMASDAQSARRSQMSSQSIPERKSLINRLIMRIRSM